MRIKRRVRAYCRVADAAAGKRGLPIAQLEPKVVVAIVVLWFSGSFLFFATAAHRLHYAVGAPASFACFALAIWVGGSTQHRTWLNHHRRLHGQCRHCGFDLRHSPDHCPECGSPVTDADRKHITATFTATEAGAVTESHFTKIWLSSTAPRHLLTLQRATHDSPEIFITYDLEPHSTPGQILSCSLAPDHLHLKLTGYFNSRYDHFHITLSIPPSQYESIAPALRSMLQGTYAKFLIE